MGHTYESITCGNMLLRENHTNEKKLLENSFHFIVMVKIKREMRGKRMRFCPGWSPLSVYIICYNAEIFLLRGEISVTFPLTSFHSHPISYNHYYIAQITQTKPQLSQVNIPLSFLQHAAHTKCRSASALWL